MFLKYKLLKMLRFMGNNRSGSILPLKEITFIRSGARHFYKNWEIFGTGRLLILCFYKVLLVDQYGMAFK